MFNEGFYLHRLITHTFEPPKSLRGLCLLGWRKNTDSITRKIIVILVVVVVVVIVVIVVVVVVVVVIKISGIIQIAIINKIIILLIIVG